MSKNSMKDFNKIKNVNLAELDADNRLEQTLNPQKETVSQEADKELKAEDKEIVEGRHYSLDAEITETELRNFLIGHAYRQPFIVLITLGAAILPCIYTYAGSNPAIAFLVAAMVLIYYPFSIFLKSKRIKRQNATFNEIFHYSMDEKEFHLRLNEEAIDVEWKYFRKMMVLKSVTVVYTGKHNGYIMPTKDMGSQKDEIIAFLREKIGQ